MNLYGLALRLSELIPNNYNNVTQLYIYLKANKTLQQLTHRLPTISNIKLSFFIDSIKKNLDRKTVEWSINNNLYVCDIICFDDHPGNIVCDECKGDGVVKCKNCKGKQVVSCSNCDGSGQETTVDRYGADDVEECSVCDGDGVNICDTCKGYGDYDCPKCEGNGYVDDIEDIPAIEVNSYISYDLNLESELEFMLSNTSEVSNKDFFENYPIISIPYQIINSTDIDVGSISEEYWGNCYINNIDEFDESLYISTGDHYQVLKRENFGKYEINKKFI